MIPHCAVDCYHLVGIVSIPQIKMQLVKLEKILALGNPVQLPQEECEAICFEIEGWRSSTNRNGL